VVTSIAVATTVKNAANSFVENFRLAAIPQIIKSYAGDRQDESKSLLLNSTKYCFFLLYTLGFPIILVAPELLGLWLGFIPEYSVIFLRVIIISSMFQIFVDSFYTILNARGRIKGYSLMYSGVMFLNLPIVYVLFRLGFPPYALVFVLLASYMLLSMLLLPILIVRITDYSYTEILRLFGVCFLVSFFAMVIPVLLLYNCEFTSSFIKLVILSSVSVASTGLSVWFVGIDKEMRNKIREKLKQISHRS
jgi:polysaccharide biosynthesis protein